MKFQNAEAMNFEGAFRGLRNPLESWNKSDSWFGIKTFEQDYALNEVAEQWTQKRLQNLKNSDYYDEEFNDDFRSKIKEGCIDWLFQQGRIKYDKDAAVFTYIGPNDLNLAQRMIRAGTSDRKFMRQIMVSVDITAPLYWWKEFDTYKVGTVANSTSTMHKLASTPITKECFEMDDFNEDMMMYENEPYNPDIYLSEYWNMLINDLEYLRKKYNETKDKKWWKELIRLLPESWLQTRTVTLNYQILRNIYSQRKNHRLTEWHSFCDWIKTLPYAHELILHNLD